MAKEEITGPLGTLEYCKNQHGNVDLVALLWWSNWIESLMLMGHSSIFDHS